MYSAASFGSVLVFYSVIDSTIYGILHHLLDYPNEEVLKKFLNCFICIYSVPGSNKLHNLINKLKKWIKLLEAKTKSLPKSFLIEEKCRFLSNFSLSTAEVELPGEFLLPKVGVYLSVCVFMCACVRAYNVCLH